MFDWIFNFFKKEEKEELYPAHFIKVILNPVAKSKGINDNFNKEVIRIKNGIEVERREYSPELLENMKKVYSIPVFEEVYNDAEEYDYDSFNDLAIIRYKK